MNKPIKNITPAFEQIISLTTEARNRVYCKANAELVRLYFSIGKIVSEGKDEEVVEYALSRNISPALIADYELN